MRNLSFTMSAGVAGMLASAGRVPDRAPVFHFEGDLCQMAAQEELLLKHRFDVGRSDVYPVLFNKDDIPKALKLIYQCRCEGWWHYQEKYAEFGICTKAEFDTRLSSQCARERERDSRENDRRNRY